MDISQPVSTFDFETIYLDELGHEHQRSQHQGTSFTELLGDGAFIEMVLLPEGTGTIGSPTTEQGHMYDEEEPYAVVFAPFCMSKYPITQAQWRAVANLPKVTHALNPSPAAFKNLNKPVEQVSWFEAVEFCNRLSQQSQRAYRLPTASEWEYACRAGTNTPFFHGETLTTDVANYCGEHRHKHNSASSHKRYSGTYGRGPLGIARGETTEVGLLPSANAFGLYDMHGNVWEWCMESPRGETREEAETYQKPVKGGSWQVSPTACRAAFHLMFVASSQTPSVGFRIVHCPTEAVLSSHGPPSSVMQSIFSNVTAGGDINIYGDITQLSNARSNE
ncbi:MAG: formylglycine-generating enzyme family protein [Cyanobacteria bacterium J06598_3]